MASNISAVNFGPMDWTEEHDKALMKEVRVQNPFQAKKKTSLRAKIWLSIAETLSGSKNPPFKDCMTKRSVQDRYTLVSEKHRQRIRKEEKASGISPPYSALDQLIEECNELEKLEDDVRQKDGETNSSKSEKDKESALEMRRIAMETFGDSKKRKKGEDEDSGQSEKKRKCRNSGSDTIEYLREQNTEQAKIREQELQMKERQQEIEKQRYESMMHLIGQQQQQQHQIQQQQQQQQQQFQAVMQQQSQLMLALIQQLNKGKT